MESPKEPSESPPEEIKKESKPDDQTTESSSLSREQCPMSGATFLSDLAQCLEEIGVNEATFRERLLALRASSLLHKDQPDDSHSGLFKLEIFPPGHGSSSPDNHLTASPEENSTRSDAITLIRARTLTRLSPSEEASTTNTSTQPHRPASGRQLPGTSNIIMQPVQGWKKVKNNKKKNKKKKKPAAPPGENSSTPTENREPAQQHEPEQEPTTHSNARVLAILHRQEEERTLRVSSSLKTTQPGTSVQVSHDVNADDSPTQQNAANSFEVGTKSDYDELFPELSSCKFSKAKRRVSRADATTGDVTPEKENIENAHPESTPPEDIISLSRPTPASENQDKAEDDGTKSSKVQTAKANPTMAPEAQQIDPSSAPTSKAKAKELPSQVAGLSLNASPKSSPKKDGKDSSSDSNPPVIMPSPQSPRASPTITRKSILPASEQLSPIQEVSNGSQVARSPPAAEAQSVLTSTPTSPSSTTWTNNPGLQNTPHTESSESESKATEEQTAQSTTSQTIASSHAHPSPSNTSARHQSHASYSTRGVVSTRKPPGFFWQLDSHGFPCAKQHCDKRCNLWDGATVICPRCGPFSETRYCCREHLFDDVKIHWLSCGEQVFVHPCRETSIPRQVRNGPPLVPCFLPYDTPERHRQAVHFNANTRRGDYFIFSDWQDMLAAGLPDSDVSLRCSPRVVYAVVFDDPVEKDRFRRVLAICLFMTIEVTELIDYLFRLIRDRLRSQNMSPELATAVKYQIHREFNVIIQPTITGERHACDTGWDGRNRRNCADTVCRNEYRRLLGSPGGRGHRQLVDNLEGNYWVLRAARTTHPDVDDAQARMCGEGFDEVADEDRRVFHRGDGWDGAGTGEMEIEGVNA